MRKIVTIVLLWSLTWHSSQAQTPVRYELSVKNKYFVAIAPPAQSKGLIVFIPAFNQPAEAILKETAFHDVAYIHGLATIVVPCGSKLFADREVVALLNESIQIALKKYNIPPEKVVIGGYSAGGTIALRYSQFCLKFPKDYPVVPKAIFNVDGPVDVQTLHENFVAEIERGHSTQAVSEASFYKNILESELDGNPREKSYRYQEVSPYSREQDQNISILKETPVRSYHDIDVNWHLQQKGRSVYEMNLTPASAMITELRRLGNEHAELKLTYGKGKRTSGELHPHSMSIVEDTELVIWILQNLNIPFVRTNTSSR